MSTACLNCESPDAPFRFGPPLTNKPYRLCHACWLMTPEGQRQAALRNRQLNELDSDNGYAQAPQQQEGKIG